MVEVVLTEDQKKHHKNSCKEKQKEEEIAEMSAIVRAESEIFYVRQKCQLMVDLFQVDDETIELSSDGAWGLSYIFREIVDLLDKVEPTTSLEKGNLGGGLHG